MKKKRQYSRRRQALRYAFRAVITLLLVNHFLLIGLLFPIQAIRQNEEREGTGRTAVVLRDWAPELYWSHLIYLTESENATMLSGAYLTYLGWMGGFGVPVDCSEPAPVYGGWWSLNRQDKPGLFYVFGRIDDPDIAYIKVQVQYEDWTSGEPVRRTAFEWGISRENWAEKDGRYYFLCRKSPMDWSEYSSPVQPVAVGYDKDNREIARTELEQGASSHFG